MEKKFLKREMDNILDVNYCDNEENNVEIFSHLLLIEDSENNEVEEDLDIELDIVLEEDLGIELDIKIEDDEELVELLEDSTVIEVIDEEEEGEILYLTEAEKNELAEKDAKLVKYMAKKFINTGINEDELTGIAYEGYVKALKMYRKNKKTKFSTYACKCMANEILCFLRKEKKWSDNVTSMNAPIGMDKNGNSLDLERILKQENVKELDEVVISKDIDNLVLASLSVLNETEKYITLHRFGLNGKEEKTQKVIAEDLGISQAYVSKLEKDCLMKIKKYIQEEDLKNGVLGKNSYFIY